MIKLKHILNLLLILIFHISFSQEKSGNVKIDSLINLLPNIKVDTSKIIVLNEIGEHYRYLNPTKGIEYANKALIQSKKINWKNGQCVSLITLGQNKAIAGNNDAALFYFNEAIPFALTKTNQCKVYRSLGILNSTKSNYSKALEYYFKALKIIEKSSDEKELANVYFTISGTYSSLNNNEKALLFSKKSLSICEKLNLKPMISKNLQRLGFIYYQFKKYDVALNYFSKGLIICKDIEDKDGIASIYLSKGLIYFHSEDYEKALEFTKKGEKIGNEIGNYRYIVSSKLHEAQIYIMQFKQDSTNLKKRELLNDAEILLLEVIDQFKKTNDKVNVMTSYETLSLLYKLQNKYKEAHNALLKYVELKDLIYNEEAKQTIKNLEDKRTIEIKNKEIEINRITLKNKEKQKWIYLIAIGLLIFLGGSLYYQNLKRKQSNKKLISLNSELDIANKTKIRFLSILNHDLRSPVYNFIHFMQLQKESPELLDVETKSTIETKTINSAENLLASMEDLLLWSKGQMNNFEPQIKKVAINSIFEDTKNHFESEEKISIQFINPQNLSLATDENYLKTIVRNLTGNAIKALADKTNPLIIWKAWQENDKTYLSITDNASGGTPEKFKALYDENEVVGIKTGLGLHLIRDLSKAINCEVMLTNSNETGTIITLLFKLNSKQDSNIII